MKIKSVSPAAGLLQVVLIGVALATGVGVDWFVGSSMQSAIAGTAAGMADTVMSSGAFPGGFPVLFY